MIRGSMKRTCAHVPVKLLGAYQCHTPFPPSPSHHQQCHTPSHHQQCHTTIPSSAVPHPHSIISRATPPFHHQQGHTPIPPSAHQVDQAGVKRSHDDTVVVVLVLGHQLLEDSERLGTETRDKCVDLLKCLGTKTTTNQLKQKPFNSMGGYS